MTPGMLDALREQIAVADGVRALDAVWSLVVAEEPTPDEYRVLAWRMQARLDTLRSDPRLSQIERGILQGLQLLTAADLGEAPPTPDALEPADVVASLRAVIAAVDSSASIDDAMARIASADVSAAVKSELMTELTGTAFAKVVDGMRRFRS